MTTCMVLGSAYLRERREAVLPVGGSAQLLVAPRSDLRSGPKVLSSELWSEPHSSASLEEKRAGLLVASSTNNSVLTAANTVAQHSFQYPSWASGLLFAGFVVGLATAVGSVIIRDRELDRKVYWLGWLVTTLCFAAAVSPRGWQGSAAIGSLGLFAAVTYAYLRTPYLKIGGHTYSVMSHQETNGLSAPPSSTTSTNSYRVGSATLSARNMWWLLVALACLVSTAACVSGWNWRIAAAAAFFVLLAAVSGADDGARNLPVARGQHLQAILISAASVPLGLAPTISYYVAYRAVRRWPIGPSSRQP